MICLRCSFYVGCNERAGSPSRPIMPHSSDEPTCPKFQPNIFDPSRCHDCLRQRHLHAGAGESTDVPRQKSTAETETGALTGTGLSKEVLLTPIPSQAEERDTSSKVRKRRCQKGGGREWRWEIQNTKSAE